MNAPTTIRARNTYDVLANIFDGDVAQEILVLTYDVSLRQIREGEWYHSPQADAAENTFREQMSEFGGENHQSLHHTEISGWLK